MTFWKVAAAVLMFKLLGLCLAYAVTSGQPPIAAILAATIVWLLVSGIIWRAFFEADRAFGPRND